MYKFRILYSVVLSSCADVYRQMDMDISVLTYFSNKIKIFFNYYFQKNLLPLHFIKLEFAQVRKRYEYPSEAHTNTEQNFVTCLI